MKLAVFSPVAPHRSAIADYTEELLPHLRRHAEVDVWIDGGAPTHPAVTSGRWFDYRADPALLGRVGGYDGVICHMGNDVRWHAGIHDVVRRSPTVVVLHDAAIPHFFQGLAATRGNPWLYLTEVEREHGRAARDAAEIALAAGHELPHQADALRMPLVRGVVEAAAGVIVHAAWSKERLDRLELGVPVCYVPPSMEVTRTPSPGSGQARLRLGIFGLATPEKGIERVLRVLAGLVDTIDVELWIVGDLHPVVDVRAMAREYGVTDRVLVTDHVSMAEFLWRIEQVDLALNLREQTAGETSNSMLRLMAAGVPTIVSDIGAFAEVPEGCVAKVPHGPAEDEVLRSTILELARRPELRRRLGRAGWEHVRTHHRPADVAATQMRFIEKVTRDRAVGALRRALAPVTAIGPEAALAVDGLVDGLVPEPPVQFVDDNLPAPRPSAGRVPPPTGVDWQRGAREYLGRLPEHERAYLITKPYFDVGIRPAGYDGPGVGVEAYRHLADAADLVSVLRLPPGSRILDAACGSGWLTEHLARFGYQVTGADVSRELVELARERVAAAPQEVAPGRPLRADFVVHDLEGPPLAEQFDAVVILDALHHVHEEGAAVAHLAAMVAPGGLLYVVEGERPRPGSAGEAELRAVMAEYETLESPFDHAYLTTLIERTGLEVIGDYLPPSGLVDRSELVDGRVPVVSTGYHRILAKRVLAPSRGTSAERGDGLRAQWAVRAPIPFQVAPGDAFTLPVTIVNAGDRIWLADRPGRRGAVSVATRVGDDREAWTALPQSIGPREQVDVDLELRAPDVPGHHRITADLVASDVQWFGEAGSEVLQVDLLVG